MQCAFGILTRHANMIEVGMPDMRDIVVVVWKKFQVLKHEISCFGMGA